MPVARGVAIPLAEVSLRTSRSSGPGGQHANVTATRVEATFDVASSTALSDDQKRLVAERVGSVVSAVAQDSRSQAHNRELALERLRGKLAAALVVHPPRRRTRPTRSAEEERLATKRRVGERKRARRRPQVEE